MADLHLSRAARRRSKPLHRRGWEEDHPNLREAASFYSHSAALDFAKENGITIDGAMKYIAQVDWPSTR